MANGEQYDRTAYMNNYMKEYRKKNSGKYKIKERCELCDCEYRKNNKSNHLNTKKHKSNELLLEFNKLKESMKSIISVKSKVKK